MRVLIVLPMTILFCGSVWAAGISTSIPSSLVASKSKFWKAVMTELYGPYNKRRKCWIGRSSGHRFCMRPHKLKSVTTGSSSRHYVVAGGYQINDGGGRDECHGCAGVMGLVVLEDGDKNLKVTAKSSLFDTIGSWGHIPDEGSFELHEIGRGGAYGWTIASGFTGQGYTVQAFDILGVVGDQFRSLGKLPKGWDDSGNCEDGENISNGGGCTDIQVQMSFIPDNAPTFYPVLLEMSGVEEGKAYSKRFRLSYDEGLLAYKIPKDMPKGF